MYVPPHEHHTQWAEEMSQSVESLLPKHVHLNLMCSSQVKAGVGEGALQRETEASLGLAGQPMLPIPELKLQRENLP